MKLLVATQSAFFFTSVPYVNAYTLRRVDGENGSAPAGKLNSLGWSWTR